MDSSYILRLEAGDETCFEEIYYAYNRNLFTYFYKRIHSRIVCEDLVQETFIRLWKYRLHLNRDLSFDIQLFRIAKTALIDVARQNSRIREVSMPNEELPEIKTADETIVINSEKKEYLLDIISILPPARKKILGLRINGYSNKEIAAMLAVSVKTVENNINIAYHELRKLPNLSPVLILVLFL